MVQPDKDKQVVAKVKKVLDTTKSADPTQKAVAKKIIKAIQDTSDIKTPKQKTARQKLIDDMEAMADSMKGNPQKVTVKKDVDPEILKIYKSLKKQVNEMSPQEFKTAKGTEITKKYLKYLQMIQN